MGSDSAVSKGRGYELWGRLLEFYTPEEALTWLQAPHPQLEGESAIDAIMKGRIDDVFATLARLEDSAYV